MLVAAGLLFIGQHLRTLDPLNVVPPPDYQSVSSMHRYYGAVENLYRLQGFDEDPTVDPAKRGEMPGLDYLQAYRAYIEERAFPRDSVDWDAWQRGAIHREKMPAATTASGRDRHGPRGTWSFVGPRNLDIPYRIYYGQPPLTGRINAIAVDPSNDQAIYVGAASGGLWKTVDAGTSWTPLSDKWPFLHVSCIAIHPDQPNTVYVGTGDFDGSVGYTNGIMKSTDGGATWSQIAVSAMNGRACREIVIDPENPQIVTAFFGRGSAYFGRIFRSTNAGGSWTNVTPGTSNVFNDAAIGAADGGTRIMWTTDNNFRRLYKSVDRGATWTEITNVGFQGSGGQVRIAASPVHAETAYILEATASPGRILKTEDAGATWTVVNNNFVNGDGDNYNWSQRGYNAYIECSARQVGGEWQDVLYVGMIDLVQSLDGGQNWRSVGGPAYVWDSVLHNDQHCVAVNPSNWNEIYTGLDGGINRFNLDPTTGDFTWQYLSAELGVTQFYRSAYHPTDTTRMLGGTQDNATPVAAGDLASWQNHGGGDGGWCAVNPIDPDQQYATAQNLAIYRTTTGWTTGSYISPNWGGDRRAFIAPIVLAPSSPHLLYAGTNYLWRYDASSNSWTPRLGGQELSSTGEVMCIAVAPSNAARLYTGSDDGQVWTSPDEGATWTRLDNSPNPLPAATIKFISVHPSNPTDVLVTLSGTGHHHVWRCANTAAASPVWVSVSGSGAGSLPDVPANAIARDPFNASTWYVGTDLGVFMTRDGGSIWENATAPLGLPNVQVNDVQVVPGTGHLYAATWGRGIWRLPIGDTRRLTGTVTLNQYTGDRTRRSITIQIRNTGSTTALETTTVPLDAAGGFVVFTGVQGTYDIAIQGSHFLRKKLSGVTIPAGGLTGLAATLENGDVNGDNAVSISDFLVLRSVYGTTRTSPNWNENADLNGDGSVGIADFLILRARFGSSGDQ